MKSTLEGAGMQPNTRILETITNRTQARATANDADGLRAIIAAAERGRELAAKALASLDLDPDTPDAGTPTSNTVNQVGASEPSPLASIAAEHSEAGTPATPSKPIDEQARILRKLEEAAASDLYAEVMAQGGIRPSTPDLREEYRAVPPSYRRPDGMPGDQMAEHLQANRPELGVTDENSLLAFFESRRIRARNQRAA